MARHFTRTSSQYFDGLTAAVTAAPLTISAWVKFDSFVTDMGLVSIAANNLTDLFRAMRSTSSSTFDAGAWHSGGGDVAISGNADVVTTGIWYHYTGRFNSSTSRYCAKNGTYGAQSMVAAVPVVDRILLGVQRYNGNNTFYLDGDLAEVGIWDVALTDEETMALAKGYSPLLIRPQNLRHYFPLLGRTTDEQDWITGGTLTNQGGATVSDHPPHIIMPYRPRRATRVLTGIETPTFVTAASATGDFSTTRTVSINPSGTNRALFALAFTDRNWHPWVGVVYDPAGAAIAFTSAGAEFQHSTGYWCKPYKLVGDDNIATGAHDVTLTMTDNNGKPSLLVIAYSRVDETTAFANLKTVATSGTMVQATIPVCLPTDKVAMFAGWFNGTAGYPLQTVSPTTIHHDDPSSAAGHFFCMDRDATASSIVSAAVGSIGEYIGCAISWNPVGTARVLKTGGIFDNLRFLLALDGDGDTVRVFKSVNGSNEDNTDAVQADMTVHANVTRGTMSWNGHTVPYMIDTVANTEKWIAFGTNKPYMGIDVSPDTLQTYVVVVRTPNYTWGQCAIFGGDAAGNPTIRGAVDAGGGHYYDVLSRYDGTGLVNSASDTWTQHADQTWAFFHDKTTNNTCKTYIGTAGGSLTQYTNSSNGYTTYGNLTWIGADSQIYSWDGVDDGRIVLIAKFIGEVSADDLADIHSDPLGTFFQSGALEEIGASLIATLAAVAVSGTTSVFNLAIYRPGTDLAADSWTSSSGTGTLASHVDEASPDTNDYIQSPTDPSGSTVALGFLNVGAPVNLSNGRLSYTVGADGGAQTVVRLRTTSGIAAEWTHATTPNRWQRYDQMLTEAQMQAVPEGEWPSAYLEVVAG